MTVVNLCICSCHKIFFIIRVRLMNALRNMEPPRNCSLTIRSQIQNSISPFHCSIQRTSWKVFETTGRRRKPSFIVWPIQILVKQKHDGKFWLKSIRKNQRLLWRKPVLITFLFFTTSFIKQMVCLALNTFNEKTSAELLWRGNINAAVAQF